MIVARRGMLLGASSLLASSLWPSLGRAQQGLVRLQEVESLLRAYPVDCSPQDRARMSTLHRMTAKPLPMVGKSIVVNIASQQLVCYQDGVPELAMKVVCGSPRNATPQLLTEMVHVIPNPTWTIPASILREPSWQRRLRNGLGPNYSVSNGRVVQKPGPNNALGLVKFSLKDAGAIYLHDTNEKPAFDREQRLISHGCVRVHRPFALAAWALGMEEDAFGRLQRASSTRYMTPPEPITVLLGYFTAWPDASGDVQFYKDGYNKDSRRCQDFPAPQTVLPQDMIEDVIPQDAY